MDKDKIRDTGEGKINLRVEQKQRQPGRGRVVDIERGKEIERERQSDTQR